MDCPACDAQLPKATDAGCRCGACRVCGADAVAKGRCRSCYRFWLRNRRKRDRPIGHIVRVNKRKLEGEILARMLAQVGAGVTNY